MPMSNHLDRSEEIARHEALIGDLRARGLPTYMATNILEKLITDRDAAAADARMHRHAAHADA